jgi:hypothetical protein
MKQLKFKLKGSKHMYVCVKLDEEETLTSIVLYDPDGGIYTPLEELGESMRKAVLLSLFEIADHNMALYNITPESIGFSS